MELSAIQGFVILAITTLGGFFGTYLSGYLTTKGQNLATHEDIDKLVDQVKAVTETTKEIEARVSGDLWDRQKRWELKRDAVFEVLKKIAGVENELSGMHAVYLTEQQRLMRGQPERVEVKVEHYRKFSDATNELDQAGLILGMACNEELRKKLIEFGLFARDIAAHVHEGNPAAFTEGAHEFVKKQNSAVEAMRNELYRPGTSPSL